MELQRPPDSRLPVSDEQIVELYWKRDEIAIRETDLKYRKYLLKVAYNILRDRQDCEECLNDTYVGVWNAIPPARPHGLKAFLTTVMRRVAINRYHSNRKKGSIPSEMTVSLSELEGILTEQESPEDAYDAARLGEIITDFVQNLPKRGRYVFMSRYYMAETVERIARDLGVSRSTVHKELAAIRRQLKEKLESEGYTV